MLQTLREEPSRNNGVTPTINMSVDYHLIILLILHDDTASENSVTVVGVNNTKCSTMSKLHVPFG